MAEVKTSRPQRLSVGPVCQETETPAAHAPVSEPGHISRLDGHTDKRDHSCIRHPYGARARPSLSAAGARGDAVGGVGSVRQ